ncbi:phenylacetic acid degradation protein PaaN [Arcobacter sp. LA11]|uniref:phenylacetic acid degradation protein PaaN n=1 Tax=Arcobacter sp. LA11 TaxID=1898176 RepID=UPI000934839F|nr:phenylacetic acid degradation protein PaaN [Arcobacter sp. LA11]
MSLFEKHNETLTRALEEIKNRGYWSPYFEIPSSKVYGEGKKEESINSFKGQLNNRYEIKGLDTDKYLGAETSPYGFDLGITYPSIPADTLVENSKKAMNQWKKISLDERAGICLEILDRINKRSFEIANAVMHTTGQPYMMAFQAGGPHAQDRGLEALAYAYKQLADIPTESVFTKPTGRDNPPIVVNKKLRVAPRGISLIITCSTFPTWNSYSALFASLVTGNSIIYKPHRNGILPIALTVEIAREVLEENGVCPDLVSMIISDDRTETQNLVKNKAVKIIDFTGSTSFGDWLEDNAPQANVYTEKAGVNCLIVDNYDNLKGMTRNMSMALSLYSSQMCTAPQNIFIPKDGVVSNGEKVSFDEVASMIAGSVEKLLSVDERATEILGAIQNSEICQRVEEAGNIGEVILESKEIKHPMFENATIKTPVIVKISAEDKDKYHNEHFGPVILLIETESREDTLAVWQETIELHGAITAGVYTSDEEYLKKVEDIAIDEKVNLSVNLTGHVLMNHSAAFTDFHATGDNKAANCALSNDNFVSGRYSVVTIKRDA